MEIPWSWLTAIGAWIVAALFHKSVRRPSLEKRIVEIDLASWIRIPTAIVLTIFTLGSFAILVIPLFPGPWRTDPQMTPAVLVGIGFGFLAAAQLFRDILRFSSLIGTTDGLYLGHVYVPWRDITEFHIGDHEVQVVAPTLRRFWNLWRTRLELPLHFYRRDEAALRRLLELSAKRP